MEKMRIVYIRGAVLCMALVALLASADAHAATLHMDPQVGVYGRGETIVVKVRIQPDGECINSVQSTIRYGEGVSLIDVSQQDSIFSLWVTPPSADESSRTLTFAGGIPGGYCGRISGDPGQTDVLAQFIFRVPSFSVGAKAEEVFFTFDEEATKVLLNDGRGTPADVSYVNAYYALVDERQRADDPWLSELKNDVIAPEPFTIHFVNDPNVMGGKSFIVFSTTDKQSGIDYYEVEESSLEDNTVTEFGGPVGWVKAEGMYVMKDQKLNSMIRVRAVDKAGNQRVSVFIPNEEERTKEGALHVRAEHVLYGLIGVLIISVLFIVVFMLRRRKPRID